MKASQHLNSSREVPSKAKSTTSPNPSTNRGADRERVALVKRAICSAVRGWKCPSESCGHECDEHALAAEAALLALSPLLSGGDANTSIGLLGPSAAASRPSGDEDTAAEAFELGK